MKLRYTVPITVKQTNPIMPQILLKIRKQLDLSQKEYTVFWAICLSAFFSLFRKSNLIPNLFAEVKMKWSKTRQMGRQVQTFLLPEMLQTRLCPVRALSHMFNLIHAEDNQHCFTMGQDKSFTYMLRSEPLTPCNTFGFIFIVHTGNLSNILL